MMQKLPMWSLLEQVNYRRTNLPFANRLDWSTGISFDETAGPIEIIQLPDDDDDDDDEA